MTTIGSRAMSPWHQPNWNAYDITTVATFSADQPQNLHEALEQPSLRNH
jgi:hypothetical protein